MTASELRYLIAIDELCQENVAVKQSDLATKLCVTKVSAFNAMERLCEKGFVTKNKRVLTLTEHGNRYCPIIVLLLNLWRRIYPFIVAHRTKPLIKTR